MTEAEAKKKWCPFARIAETSGTYNRCGPAANLDCIGSLCMAWRGDVLSPHKDEQRGHCGLVGEP